MFRPEFATYGLVEPEVYISNTRANAAHVPAVSDVPTMALPHDIPLAVVGGGHSAREALEELRSWPGHIWGINQTATWLAKEAPNAHVTLFTVDPDPNNDLNGWLEGVERALLGSCCNPNLFKALEGKDVRVFHNHPIEGLQGLTVKSSGSSSVTRTLLPALWLGYRSITYFGCEGSLGATTHCYRNDSMPDQMIVRCGDKEYVTTPLYYLGTEHMAQLLLKFPHLMREKSGGLLRGMIEHPDTWEVVALSESLRNKMDPTANVEYAECA